LISLYVDEFTALIAQFNMTHMHLRWFLFS